ncbi:MAG: glycosyltransferase family 4 protein [Patescibacteria group bacterium]
MNKTLLVTIDFPPMIGGVANYWANLNKCLPKEELVILAPEYDNSHSFDIRQNYLIYRKNLISKKKWLWPRWLPLFYSMYRLIKMEGIKTIIAGQVLPVGTAAYLLSKIMRVNYVVSTHGMDIKIQKPGSRRHWLIKRIIKNADHVITNSRYTMREVVRLGGKPEQISVIYPCPNIEDSSIDPALRDDIVKEYELAGKKILLTVGRLVERKGHDRVIQSLTSLVEHFPNIIYLIIGRGPNLNNLKQLVDRLRLQQNVLFFDRVDDDELRIFYDLADVFIMTSRELSCGDVEGFGIVYLEANGFKKPVIAGRTGGAVEAVEHGVNGLLVDPDDFECISQAIAKLMADTRLAKKLGENGFARNKRSFCWPMQARKLQDILSSKSNWTTST